MIELKEYSLIGKIGSFKLQIFSSSLNALDFSTINFISNKKKFFLC